MLYGAAKAREMGRSILPSTQSSAHVKQIKLSRRARRVANHNLATMEWSEDGWLDDEQDLTSDRWRNTHLGYLVRDRRGHDKTGPVERWAAGVTADMRLLDRRAHIEAVLPRNLIGWHAMTHIEDTDAFYIDHSMRRTEGFVASTLRRKADAKLRREWAYYELHSLLERVIIEGRRRALNSVIRGNWKPRIYYTEEFVQIEGETPGVTEKIRTRHVDDVPPRALQGRDDIARFMAEVFGTGRFVWNGYTSTTGLPLERDRCLSYLAQVYEYTPGK